VVSSESVFKAFQPGDTERCILLALVLIKYSEHLCFS